MVSVGLGNTCVVVSDGTVECWGGQAYLTVGSSAQSNTTVPTKVGGVTNATSVSVSSTHACALLSTGTIQCWGRNDSGELGNGTITTTVGTNSSGSVTGITSATQVAAGPGYTCALLSTGTVQCWGGGANGYIGNGVAGTYLTPVQVTGITNATSISAGAYQACAKGDTLKCWGYNGNLSPVQMLNANGALSTGTSSSCIAGDGDHVYCWGNNNLGQLGTGNTNNSTNPTQVQLGMVASIAVSVGSDYACAILGDTTVRCWGASIPTANLLPVIIPGITTATSISAGYGYTCAVLSNGSVKCWDNSGSMTTYSNF